MGPRPLVPVPHGAGGPARRLRAGAHAFERPTPSNETEYRRKVRMFEHCWEITLRGSMFRRLPPLYLVELVSHRLLRYGSGILHVVLLATSVALVSDGWAYGDRARRRSSRCSRAAAAGLPIARYYVLVTWATRRGALELRCDAVCRRRGRPRRGRGEPRPRHRGRRLGSRVASPLLAAARARDQAGGRRAGALPADPRRQGRRRLRVAEIAHDGRRRRADRAPATPSSRATPASRASAGSCARPPSTSCRSSGTSSAAK